MNESRKQRKIKDLFYNEGVIWDHKENAWRASDVVRRESIIWIKLSG